MIPFACIKKIGPDIILVEIKEEKKFLQKILDIVYNEGNKIRGKAEWII